MQRLRNIITMKRKRIDDITQIYDGENLLITDFSNLDLSNIDLSHIPMNKWESCTFYNTSFKNTGIKFIPAKLNPTSHYGIEYCDFSDNDLSFLQHKDFCRDYDGKSFEIYTNGCNFRNTDVNCIRKFFDITLDESYGDFDYSFWDIGRAMADEDMDINTVIKNPFLKIPSAKLLYIIAQYWYASNRNRYQEWFQQMQYANNISSDDYLNDEYKLKQIQKCEQFLELDTQGFAKKFYEQISKNFTLENKFNFFGRQLTHNHFKDIVIKDIPINILQLYQIQDSLIENMLITNSMKELLQLYPEYILDLYNPNTYKSLYLPAITPSSWTERNANQKRISDSAISFFTKIYLELSRTCNARCPFCRNSTFEETKYDLKHIKETLDMVKNHVNAVVIGGGEPTLRLDDVKDLRDYFAEANFDWHMFTNGTNPSIIYNPDILLNFDINLSRHAVDDNENAKIFGVSPSKIMTSQHIEQLNMLNETTLNATCFKGGLDSVEKIIEFITYAKQIGCKKVLIQDLQTSNSLGKKDAKYNSLYIDPMIFTQVMEYLRSLNFRQKKYPIYATGGYVSYIFKDKDKFTISIQHYISKKELQENWPKAIKRAFDLSIDPSGNLYENWHQQSGLVSSLENELIK